MNAKPDISSYVFTGILGVTSADIEKTLKSSPLLILVPINFSQAKEFVRKHHRHNPNVKMAWKFGVGVANRKKLVGVAMAGLPAARMAMIPGVLEINRTCTTGEKNANSMLYGAIARAAKALGYHKLITYTLPRESGSSLKATGWAVETTEAGSVKSWREKRGTGSGDVVRGRCVRVAGPKIRWGKSLQ